MIEISDDVTVGGPLKYSLEGHRFAVFSIKLTTDFRYVVSVSNKFITWDVSTSDLARTVHPGILNKHFIQSKTKVMV